MFLRSRGSVCLLLGCLICCSPLAKGEDRPIRVTQRPEWESRIEAALDAKGEWDFFDAPLIEACHTFQDKLGIDVALDTKALEDFGIDSSTPITLSISGISNRSFLRLMLNELELTFTMRYGALWITTPEDAESRLTTKVYPVGPLLVRDRSRREPIADYDLLIGAITNSIHPDSWDEVGGPGSIEGIYDTLVISQTSDIHHQIEQLLATYNEIIASDKPEQDQIVFMLGQEPNLAAQAALDKPFTAEFKDSTLKEFAEFLSEKMGIPVVIDFRALEDFGIDTSTPISGKYTKTPLRFALARILGELELTYVIRDEVLLITTPEACERQLGIGLYPVRDLVQIAEQLPIDPPGANCDFDSLIRVITSTIGPDTWDEVGGPGSIDSLLPTPTLIISQTQDIQKEISELITKLRAAKELVTVNSEVSDPNALFVRSYPMNLSGCASDEIAMLVIRASEAGTWDDQAETFVQGLGSSLVVKHKASVHRRVLNLLEELGARFVQGSACFGCGYGGGANENASGEASAPAVDSSHPTGGFF